MNLQCEVDGIAASAVADHPELLDLRIAVRGSTTVDAVASSSISPYQLASRPDQGLHLLQPGYCLSKLVIPLMAVDLIDSPADLDVTLGRFHPGVPEWIRKYTLADALTHSLPPGPTHMDLRLAPAAAQTAMLNEQDGDQAGYSEVRSSLLVEAAWTRGRQSPALLEHLNSAGFLPAGAERYSRASNLIPSAAVDGSQCYPLFEEVAATEPPLSGPSTCSFVSPRTLAEAGLLVLAHMTSGVPVFAAEAARQHDATLNQAVHFKGGLLGDTALHSLGDGWPADSCGLSAGLIVGAVVIVPDLGSVAIQSTGMFVPDTGRSVNVRHSIMSQLAGCLG